MADNFNNPSKQEIEALLAAIDAYTESIKRADSSVTGLSRNQANFAKSSQKQFIASAKSLGDYAKQFSYYQKAYAEYLKDEKKFFKEKQIANAAEIRDLTRIQKHEEDVDKIKRKGIKLLSVRRAEQKILDHNKKTEIELEKLQLQIEKERATLQEAALTNNKEQVKISQDKLQELEDQIRSTSNKIIPTISERAKSAFSAVSKGAKEIFEDAITVYEEYALGVNTRLGSGDAFTSMSSNIFSKLTTSPYVSQQKVIENLSKLVEAGIADNIELRAFLATVSEGVATTFDAFDGTLLRLIRIQQKDSTAAYLGMEASLTELFNDTFKDSSYLSNMSDSISAAVIDASAQLSAEEGLAFQYTVQKWLGAFSEAGASDNFVSTLAAGLNMLATGDVQGLSSNSSLQSLFAMAAQNTDTSYADMLLGGMNATNTNELLYSLYSYMSSIASGTSKNNVLSRAFGDVFGFNTTDLKAIANLSSNADSIYGSNIDYSSALGVLQNQLSSYGARMPLASKIDNIVENVTFTAGSKIAQSPAGYMAYRTAGMLDDFAGGIGVEVAPFGIGISTTVSDLLRIGLVVTGILSSLDDVGSSLESNSGMDLSAWTSGGYNVSSTSGTSESGSQSVGNLSLSDSSSSGLDNINEMDISGTNEKQTDATMDDVYEEIVTIREAITEIDAANPIVVSDIQTINLITKIEDVSGQLKANTFNVNIASADNDVLIKTSLNSVDSDARIYFANQLAESIARRLTNVIYNGKSTEAADDVESDATLGALVELMRSVTDGTSSALDVNLASSDMTVKDMLVRRV